MGDAQVDNVLARPVLDPDGEEILPAGCALDEEDLTLLRRRVAYVWLETMPGESDARSAADAAQASRMKARIDAVFAGHEGSHRMQILKRLAVNHLVGTAIDHGEDRP